MKRMIQVKTNSPMKILFCGLISNAILSISKYQSRKQTTRWQATHTYFNKFRHLSPLKFAAAFRNDTVTRRRDTILVFPLAIGD